jgi:hypothetical protein
MSLSRISILALAVVSAACADSGTTPTDAGSDTARRDTGSPRDASVSDSGGDTGSATDVSTDSGGGGVVVDGVIGAAEWAGASEAVNVVASGWGEMNAFTRLLAVVSGDRLYLAIEGRLEAGAENAIVVYVDAERGSGTGVADPSELTDGEGALDNAISAGITTPADVAVDFAWGTRDFDRSQEGFDDRMGWRNVASAPGDFAWLEAAEAPTVCSAAACETSVALATLSGAGEIALFGRLVNTDGTMISNQCVPEDDPDASGTVTEVLGVSR